MTHLQASSFNPQKYTYKTGVIILERLRSKRTSSIADPGFQPSDFTPMLTSQLLPSVMDSRLLLWSTASKFPQWLFEIFLGGTSHSALFPDKIITSHLPFHVPPSYF